MDKDRSMLDPRTVFFFVVLVSSFSIVFRDPERLSFLFAVSFLTAILMKIGFRELFIKLRRLWYIIIVVALLQGIFNPRGEVWFEIGSFAILTSGGVSVGLAVLLRLATLLIGGSMLARYPNRIMVQAMIQLKLPYELAYMVSIGIRFIPIFSQSLKDSLTAIQLRGVDFDSISFQKRMQVYTYLLMPTIASGINSASQLSIAMELRGFRAMDKRSSFFTLHMEKRDYVFLLYTFLLLVGIMYLAIFLENYSWF